MKYTITEEQLETLDHYKDMFEHHASMIQSICSEDKPLINYGFQLGEVYTWQRTKYLEMMNTLDQIREQKQSGE